MWYGSYGIVAQLCAIDRALNGRKAKSKFIDEPILSNVEKTNANGEMTEAEKKRQRQLLVQTLMTMKANFDLNHKKKEDSEQITKDG